jgi:hypothetical protein
LRLRVKQVQTYFLNSPPNSFNDWTWLAGAAPCADLGNPVRTDDGVFGKAVRTLMMTVDESKRGDQLPRQIEARVIKAE